MSNEEIIASTVVLPPEEHLSLGCSIISVGHCKVHSSDYRWNGLQRGQEPFLVFQHSLKGCGQLRFKDKNFEVATDHAFLVPVPSDHEYYFDADETWEFNYSCLSGPEAFRLGTIIVDRYGPVWPFPKNTKAHRHFSTMMELALNKNIQSQSQSSQLCYGLLMDLIDHCSQSPTPDQPCSPSISKAKHFADDRFKHPIDVADMAAQTPYSRFHFSRLFKEEVGHSPKEYILKLRLQHAISLLENPELNIKQISLASGFNDLNYFCRVFKKRLGKSPGSIRKHGWI